MVFFFKSQQEDGGVSYVYSDASSFIVPDGEKIEAVEYLKDNGFPLDLFDSDRDLGVHDITSLVNNFYVSSQLEIWEKELEETEVSDG